MSLKFPFQASKTVFAKGGPSKYSSLDPTVAAALLWRRRLAHKQHRNPHTHWRSFDVCSWDQPSSRRKEERGGGWRTRLNAASIVI